MTLSAKFCLDCIYAQCYCVVVVQLCKEEQNIVIEKVARRLRQSRGQFLQLK